MQSTNQYVVFNVYDMFFMHRYIQSGNCCISFTAGTMLHMILSGKICSCTYMFSVEQNVEYSHYSAVNNAKHVIIYIYESVHPTHCGAVIMIEADVRGMNDSPLRI